MVDFDATVSRPPCVYARVEVATIIPLPRLSFLIAINLEFSVPRRAPTREQVASSRFLVRLYSYSKCNRKRLCAHSEAMSDYSVKSVATKPYQDQRCVFARRSRVGRPRAPPRRHPPGCALCIRPSRARASQGCILESTAKRAPILRLHEGLVLTRDDAALPPPRLVLAPRVSANGTYAAPPRPRLIRTRGLMHTRPGVDSRSMCTQGSRLQAGTLH